jgi:hypothetical protein
VSASPATTSAPAPIFHIGNGSPSNSAEVTNPQIGTNSANGVTTDAACRASSQLQSV